MNALIPAAARRIAPGLYAHRGEMHIDAAELLEAHGVDPTPENIDRFAEIAADVVAERRIPFEIVGEREER